MSSAYITLERRFSGTSPLTIRMAKPSAIAVLPTPGSPTNMGLFFVRRLSMCKVLRISSSRPITGSSFPALAISFRFFAYLLSALNCVSCVWEFTLSPLRNSFIDAIKPFSVSPASFNNFEAASEPFKIASNKCSGVINSSPNVFKPLFARSTILFASLPNDWAGSPETTGNFLISSSSLLLTKFKVTLFFRNK